MDKRQPLNNAHRANTQSPKYLRHQQQFKSNPKRLKRTSISEIESIDIAVHESFDGTLEQTIVYYKKYDLINISTLIALILVLLSFILIIITFIFPNWLIVLLPIINSNTIPVYAVYANQILPNSTTTLIDIGLWEFRFDQLVNIFDIDNSTLVFNSTLQLNDFDFNIYPNQTKFSVLWLSDYNRYLRELTKLIGFDLTTVFTFEILQILHLVFAFLSITVLFIILCLCKRKYFGKGIKLWHFVSFIMLLICFFTGVGTLIEINLWLNNNKNNARLIQLNWCFWCLVGDLSAILLAIIFVKINLILTCIGCCKKNDKESKLAETKGESSANSRSSVALLNRTKTTPNISAIELNHQIGNELPPPPSDDQLLRPSSFLKRNQQNFRTEKEHDYINERPISIPRPNLTSSNINIRGTSANSNHNNNNIINNPFTFDNYIYYNGDNYNRK